MFWNLRQLSPSRNPSLTRTRGLEHWQVLFPGGASDLLPTVGISWPAAVVWNAIHFWKLLLYHGTHESQCRALFGCEATE